MSSSAATIMNRFAERTGVGSSGAQQRYLWTDAFAVCNFLGLAASGDDPDGVSRARTLIDDVHHTLGRHRADDSRQGWISGLDAAAGQAHPTAGGLRIGKPLPERAPGEPSDPRREWDQDGQYFHYLTRWTHALDQAARTTGEVRYQVWARELAQAAFRAFSYVPGPGAPRRLYWKMSIDLSRPLVPAMGHHDPLDGYVTCLELATTARSFTKDVDGPASPPLEEIVSELAAMVNGGDWATDDPLGLGSLMTDAYRLFQIELSGTPVPAELLPALLVDVAAGLEHLEAQDAWSVPAERRLAFRELGLAIGIRAMERLQDRLPMGDSRNLNRPLAALAAERPLADRLIRFWLDPGNQRAATWADHQDINEVMLATALAPAGYLELGLRPGP